MIGTTFAYEVRCERKLAPFLIAEKAAVNICILFHCDAFAFEELPFSVDSWRRRCDFVHPPR